MPNGKKRKGHKMETHTRTKRLIKNRNKKKYVIGLEGRTRESAPHAILYFCRRIAERFAVTNRAIQ